MIIYKDILTGDEIISDSYDLKDIDGAVYEVDCQMIVEGAVQVDIGANASAEEAEEDLDDGVVKVNNIVHSFRLQKMIDADSYDKKQTEADIVAYLKKCKAAKAEKGVSTEEINKILAASSNYLKKTIRKNSEPYEVYMGESFDTNGMPILLNYREDGMTPFIIVWQLGLDAMKV